MEYFKDISYEEQVEYFDGVKHGKNKWRDIRRYMKIGEYFEKY
jgi:hypothetical protein